MVWNGLTITDERKENMQISIPYLTNEQAVVVKGDNASKYTKLADLAGKKVAVEKESAGEGTAIDIKDTCFLPPHATRPTTITTASATTAIIVKILFFIVYSL